MSTPSAHQQATHQQEGRSKTSPSSISAICRRYRTRARATTVLGAAVSALIGWFVAVHLLGVGLTVMVGSTAQQVGPVAACCTAGLAGLAGWGLLAVLERRTVRAKSVWTIIAATVLVLSLAGPLGATSAPAMATLILLHLAVGAVLIVGLRSTV